MRLRDLTIGEWVETCSHRGVTHNCISCVYHEMCKYCVMSYDKAGVPNAILDRYISRNEYTLNNQARDSIIKSLDDNMEKYIATTDDNLKHMYRMIIYEVLGIGLMSEQITSAEYQYYMEVLRRDARNSKV